MFLALHQENHQLITSLKKALSKDGNCFIPQEHSFLAVDQWRTLNYAISQLKYKKMRTKNHLKPLSFKISKIKHPKNTDIKNEAIYDVITSIQMRNLIELIAGINHFLIEKCDCYLCEEGDSLSFPHAPDNFNKCKYIVTFFLDGEYTGGQHIVYRSGKKKKYAYRPKSGEMLISSCESSHEIEPITSGKKNMVQAFVQPFTQAA